MEAGKWKGLEDAEVKGVEKRQRSTKGRDCGVQSEVVAEKEIQRGGRIIIKPAELIKSEFRGGTSCPSNSKCTSSCMANLGCSYESNGGMYREFIWYQSFVSSEVGGKRDMKSSSMCKYPLGK